MSTTDTIERTHTLHVAEKLGITTKDALTIATQLSKLLASTHMLALKTQGFHWNVKGLFFYSAHAMFDAQYEQLNAAVDELAERILGLGFDAPHDYQSFIEKSHLKQDKEAKKTGQNFSDMLTILLDDHHTLIQKLRPAIEQAAQANDPVTADLLTARLAEHEKTAWQLRASLTHQTTA